MASPNSIREFRYKATTDFNTTFLNAANGSWDVGGAVVKLRIVGFDDSGLVREGLPNETMQTRIYGKPAPIPGLRKGSLKVSTYLGGAESDTTACPEATLVSKFMGGIINPSNTRAAVVEAGTMSARNVVLGSANTYVSVGMAALVGVKGDSRGNGEVKIVSSVDAGGITFATVCSGTPAAGDALVFGTTCYLDPTATQEYIDTLSIGHATADQRQTIGGSGTFGISGTGIGELPKLDVELMVADHRYVPANERSALDQVNTGSGNTPPFERGIGMLQIYDDDTTTTRQVFKGGEISFTPGLAVEAHPDLSGVNGVGGWQKMPGAATMEATLLFDEDMPGLVTNFENETSKAVVLQYGHTATKCVAIDMQKCHLTDLPVPKAINNLSGVAVKLEAGDDYSATGELASSAFRIHWF